jgi:hypothetical protein
MASRVAREENRASGHALFELGNENEDFETRRKCEKYQKKI